MLVMVVTVVSACSHRVTKMMIENPLDMVRPDELVVISREELEHETDELGANDYIVLTDAKGQPVTLQYDDRDKDGKWDEIAFLLTLQPHESSVLTLSVANAPASIKAVVRAHVRQRRKNDNGIFGPALGMDSIPAGQPGTDFSRQPLPLFLTEGPAWENDKVGFRIYFDVRNGKDIWGKTTSRMMMDEVGLDTTKNYHLLSDWGMDVLKVGASLGAGSLAMMVPRAGNTDTLIRLGGINMGKVIYEKVADGPVRAIFRLRYPEWKMLDGMPSVSVTEEISIWGGQYFYESKVTLSSAPTHSQLVTGMVNFHSPQFFQVDTTGSHILYTYAQQSENNDRLGMALMISQDMFDKDGKTPDSGTDIQNTYTLSAKPGDNKPVQFRFFAGWEKSNPSFSDAESFRNFLKESAYKNSKPVIIGWKRN